MQQQPLQYSEEDRFIFDNISLLTGLTFEQIKNVFEFHLLFQLSQYLEGKPITVPYLGTLDVKYSHDEIIRGHKRAVLETKFKDSELLKRSIGEIEDGENTTILSILKNFVESQLLYLIQEESHNAGTRNQSNRKPRKREFSFPRTFTGTED